jgi:hypothetical protein
MKRTVLLLLAVIGLLVTATSCAYGHRCSGPSESGSGVEPTPEPMK